MLLGQQGPPFLAFFVSALALYCSRSENHASKGQGYRHPRCPGGLVPTSHTRFSTLVDHSPSFTQSLWLRAAAGHQSAPAAAAEECPSVLAEAELADPSPPREDAVIFLIRGPRPPIRRTSASRIGPERYRRIITPPCRPRPQAHCVETWALEQDHPRSD